MTDESIIRTGKRFDVATRIMLILFLLLLTASMASALGVAPSRQYISFEPGKIISGQLTIINNEGTDLRLGVYADGALVESVKLPETLVEISADEQTATIPYEITLPDKALRPGDHEIELVVRQFPTGSKGETVIAAQLAVISQIIVKVPYPGKYAEGKLFINDAYEPDRPVTFTVMLLNFGTEKIDDAYAKVEVFGPTWEKIGEAESEHISAEPKQEKRIDIVWRPETGKGTYRAVVTVFYDDKTLKLESNFDLGTMTIDVSDINVKKFTLGDVAKFDITLHNSWNTDIKDAFVEMIVEDKEGNQMTEFKTSTVDIPSQETRKVEAYWYTEGVMPGIYDVKMLVHYAGKLTQKEYEFEVGTNSITMLGIAGHATVTEADEREVKTQGLIIFLIIIVLIILVVMNIVWFYVLRKKLSEVKGESK